VLTRSSTKEKGGRTRPPRTILQLEARINALLTDGRSETYMVLSVGEHCCDDFVSELISIHTESGLVIGVMF